ncbi:histidine phosphatase superfamily [Podospora didyma]|uniref:Histidine phosphatase superfamily n=1 Tax=Podospora didyma TaxID=330526 RepID=A0AAE0N9Q8_9PEZI|nr:histidine phosphatase superfamily [Podospora didyma]
MSLEVIYVTRHGFRSNWLVDQTGNYTNALKSPTGGAADPALTAYGVEQARELGERLLVVDPPVERVYSSLYYRCLQTVEPFVRRTATKNSSRNLKIRGETGLGEWYGQANFEHPVPATPKALDSLFPALLDTLYRPVIEPTRIGESLSALHDRVAATMDQLVAECDRDGVRAVLLCSHAATVIALGRVLTGHMPENVGVEDFRAFTCGLSVYRRRKQPSAKTTEKEEEEEEGKNAQPLDNYDGSKISSTGDGLADRATTSRPSSLSWRGGRGVAGGWNCELNSDCSHLSGGEERGWRFSGDESFLDAKDPSILDAGIHLGVVVEGKKKDNKTKDTKGKEAEAGEGEGGGSSSGGRKDTGGSRL